MQQAFPHKPETDEGAFLVLAHHYAVVGEGQQNSAAVTEVDPVGVTEAA